MKEKIIENGIEYVKSGDYYIPNLKAPEGTYNIGISTHHTHFACFLMYTSVKTETAVTAFFNNRVPSDFS